MFGFRWMNPERQNRSGSPRSTPQRSDSIEVDKRTARLKQYQENRGCPTRLGLVKPEPEIRWIG